MRHRIVFMGTPIFACSVLQQLIEDDYYIVGVISQPDRPVGRKKECKPTPVKALALDHQIPVFQPDKIRAHIDEILALKPDLIITCAYGQMIPEAILAAPKYGCINVHASLLPKLRGGAPIHWAIIQGEKETGITIMEMVKKMDAGAMIAQDRLLIQPRETMGSLHDRLMKQAAALVHRVLPRIFAGQIKLTPQNETEVTYGYNITRAQEQIDWSQSAASIDQLIRGLNPWPGSYTTYNGQTIKIWDAVIHHCENAKKHHRKEPPGTIVKLFNDGIGVKTGDGILVLKVIQPAGKKALPVEAILRGNHPFVVGQSFGK